MANEDEDQVSDNAGIYLFFCGIVTYIAFILQFVFITFLCSEKNPLFENSRKRPSTSSEIEFLDKGGAKPSSHV